MLTTFTWKLSIFFHSTPSSHHLLLRLPLHLLQHLLSVLVNLPSLLGCGHPEDDIRKGIKNGLLVEAILFLLEETHSKDVPVHEERRALLQISQVITCIS